jgi:hypothetical protein
MFITYLMNTVSIIISIIMHQVVRNKIHTVTRFTQNNNNNNANALHVSRNGKGWFLSLLPVYISSIKEQDDSRNATCGKWKLGRKIDCLMGRIDVFWWSSRFVAGFEKNIQENGYFLGFIDKWCPSEHFLWLLSEMSPSFNTINPQNTEPRGKMTKMWS